MERFDRAVVTLDAVIAQTARMNAGYEDSLVAGVMDFLHGWFSSEIYRTIDWAVLVLTNMSSVVIINSLCLQQ
jgi:hypothetical protein